VADSVKLNRFNQSIVNTGTFTLKDSILTTNAVLAIWLIIKGFNVTFLDLKK
jgi:hypothetical protein